MNNIKRVLRIEGSYLFRKTPLPGIDYSINPYFGCEFGCIYCYSYVYFKLRGLRYKWGEYIEAKTYLPRIISRNLSKFENNSIIGIGTYTDPYQPWEAKLKLTRRILRILRRRKDLIISILTRSPLVLRDIDLIKIGYGDVGFSITSTDEKYLQYFEPYAPRPLSRLRALKYLSKEDIDTWVFIAPIMPYINDDESILDEIIIYSYKAGVKKIYSDILRFRLGVRKNIIKILTEYNPNLIDKYRYLSKKDIIERYSQVVNFLKKNISKYNMEYIDLASIMWRYGF